MQGLATNENIVVSVPGNTRFFIVLLEGIGGATLPARTVPAGGRGAAQLAAGGTSAPSSAQELRELIDLKTEIDRMYQEAAATRTSELASPPQGH